MPKPTRASSPHPKTKAVEKYKQRRSHCRAMGNGSGGDEHAVAGARSSGTAGAGSNVPAAGGDLGKDPQPCWHTHAETRPPLGKVG